MQSPSPSPSRMYLTRERDENLLLSNFKLRAFGMICGVSVV